MNTLAVARFPAELQAALETASASQVDQQSIEEGTQLLRQLERLLADIAAAVEVEQRTRSLQASKDAKVPPELLAAAELQLARLKHLHQVLRAGDVPATRRALRLAEVAGCKDQELAAASASKWSVLARELDIAVSIGETDRIRAALDQTAKSGICQAQLQPAIEALEAFKRSDAAVESLSQAMDSCDAELIYQALHSACQDSVTDSELLAGARSLLDRLLGLRQQLTRAMEARLLGDFGICDLFFLYIYTYVYIYIYIYQGGEGRTAAEAEAQDRAGEEQPKTGELRVTVIFATSGETHSKVVLPAGALVSDLAKALDETSKVPGKCSSFLRDGDRLACSRGAGVEEVTIQLVVHSLVGRWTWIKGERRDEQEAHDYECHVLLLRSDGRAQFNQFHSWRKDNENYGSKRTMIGCKERGGPRDQLSSQFLRGDDLKDEGWEPRRTGARERSPAATIVCSMWLTAASILYYIV
eukprot:s309_g1.t1